MRSFWRLERNALRAFLLFLFAGLCGLGCASSPAPPPKAPSPVVESPFAAPAEKLAAYLKDRLGLNFEQQAGARRIALALFERNAKLSDLEGLKKRRVLEVLMGNLALFEQEMFSILTAEQRLKYIGLKRQFQEAIRPRPGMRSNVRFP